MPENKSPIPFDWNVTTTKWTFGQHGYIVLEKTLDGFTMYGRVDHKPWDNDGEDFFFKDSDQLLAFLQEQNLLRLLSSDTGPTPEPDLLPFQESMNKYYGENLRQ